MRKNFNSVPMLETSEACNKYSKSVSYETLVGGTTTIGREYKQTRRLFLGSAIKPLTAVGTLTSLLCNSAKVMEKLFYLHSERSEGSIMNNIKDWILRFANAPLRMTMKRRLRMTMKRMLLRMTIPMFALIFTLITTAESRAVSDCATGEKIAGIAEKRRMIYAQHGSTLLLKPLALPEQAKCGIIRVLGLIPPHLGE